MLTSSRILLKIILSVSLITIFTCNAFQHNITSKFDRIEYKDVPPFNAGRLHAHWCFNNERFNVDSLYSQVKETLNKKKPCLFVDAGMNDGFYTQLAAMMGCSVVAFELQKSCVRAATDALYANNITDKVTIIDRPLSSKNNEILSIPMVRKEECSGVFTFSREDNCIPCPKGDIIRTFNAISLDSFFQFSTADITFLKIDVEGHEPWILNGAKNLFKTNRIKFAAIEIMDIKAPSTKTPKENFKIYEMILSYNYVIQCANGGGGKKFTSKNSNELLDAMLLGRDKFCVDWNFYLEK